MVGSLIFRRPTAFFSIVASCLAFTTVITFAETAPAPKTETTAPAPASSDTAPKLLTTLSYKTVADLLGGTEITSELVTSDDGVSYLVGTYRNTSFIMRLIGCETKKSEKCTTLAIFANFLEGEGQKITAEDKAKINQYNENEVFGRAYFSEDETSLGIDTVISIEGGATDAYVKAQLGNWKRALGRFLSQLADEDAKSAE